MHRKGFTLIELIIVIVIIGILASIAVPMIQAVKIKAICTEAVGALGSIRSALRTYLKVYGDWPKKDGFIINGPLSDYPDQMSAMGLPLNNLGGAYFGKECYGFTAIVIPTILASPRPDKFWPTGQVNTAPRANEADKAADDDAALLKMDMVTGKITQQSMSKSGYPTN